MNLIDLKISEEQVFGLARQLPKDLKLRLIDEWLEELKIEPEELGIKGYDEPFQLEEAKIQVASIFRLQQIWKDEPSAEELTQLLTK